MEGVENDFVDEPNAKKRRTGYENITSHYFASQLTDSSNSLTDSILQVEQSLSQKLSLLHFSPPVAYVYNPLAYAWDTHSQFVRRFCNSPKEILFVGMNPGPWGMVQTGIPFGEIPSVRDWLRIQGEIGQPTHEHPQRKVLGFQCQRVEVSGQRFWGFFRELCGIPENFFKNCFVYSYCPLSFMHPSGRNITPPELKSCDRLALTALCDSALLEVVQLLQAKTVIGIGKFAEYRIRETLKKGGSIGTITVGSILHPSPINPSANKGWKAAVFKTFEEMNLLHVVKGT